MVDAQFEGWCIADEQTPDDELLKALDWACGKGGADCSNIQVNKPCYLPNTIRDHASYAFNNYYQKFKNKGATCYFNSAAMITDLDPSKMPKKILHKSFQLRLLIGFLFCCCLINFLIGPTSLKVDRKRNIPSSCSLTEVENIYRGESMWK